MSKNNYKIARFIAVLFFAAVSTSLQAQTTTSSPYSRYGIGDLQFRGLSQNIGMGGVSYGLESANNLNFGNPASYSSLKYSSFEAGATSNLVTFKTNDLSQRASNTSLSYLAFGFPVSKKIGASFGLTPYSNIGYSINSSEVSNGQTLRYNYQGSGGLSQFYIGGAYKLNKSWSFGVNVSYLFGVINRERFIDFPDTSYAYNTHVKNTISVGDINLTYGLQYTKELKNDYRLVIGLSGSFANNVHATNSILEERYTYVGGIATPKDSLPVAAAQKGSLKLPAKIGIGFSLKNSKVIYALDFTTQNWSKYEAFGVNEHLDNSYFIAGGIQYSPGSNNSRNYFRSIQYRGGVHFSQTYLSLNGEQLSEKGLTVGVGLPVPKSFSIVNLSFEYGMMGTTNKDLIREDYMRINVGFTFSDIWFIKRKYD